MKAAERLTAALTAAKAPPEMIERARRGYYGDFTSPLAMPITQLVADLIAAGQTSLAKLAMAGEFDGD